MARENRKMKKKVCILILLGFCVAKPAGADYPIGTFIALKGADGAACNATITTERCGPNLSTKCQEAGQESAKSGIKMTRTDCSGGNATSFYTYDGDVGTGIYYQGELANCDALNALKNNSNVAKEPGYAWFVKNLGTGYDAGKLYIWTDNTFPDCPSGGVPFQGPQGAQGEGVCTDLENSDTAIKNTLRTYSGPSNSTVSGGVTVYATRGKMVLTHKMCNTGLSDTVDNENDPCVPIVAPSGVTCNGTYFECKPQGTYTGNTSYAKYNLCETTNGTTFSSAIATVSANVANKADQSALTTVSNKVTALETTVGNSTSGLVQQTNNLETAVANKLNKDVSFSTSGGYIKMSATGISTPVNVVAIADIKGANGTNGANGASALELWQAQQTNNTTCQKLFSKNCNALGLTEFMQDISDYGVWARAEYQANGADANVSRSAYRATLQPCQGGITLTPNGTDGSGGNKYTMTCTE